MAKMTQKTDHHSTVKSLPSKPRAFTLLLFFDMYLDLHSNMLSLGNKISEAYWCVFVTESRKKKKECLLEILKYNIPSPDLSSSGMWGLTQT